MRIVACDDLREAGSGTRGIEIVEETKREKKQSSADCFRGVSWLPDFCKYGISRTFLICRDLDAMAMMLRWPDTKSGGAGGPTHQPQNLEEAAEDCGVARTAGESSLGCHLTVAGGHWQSLWLGPDAQSDLCETIETQDRET
jgi:hypothetical protein